MESLQIRRWNEIPSAEEFSYRIEKSNVPAVALYPQETHSMVCVYVLLVFLFRNFCAVLYVQVISRCVKDWKAFSKWDVSNGGLDYLQVCEAGRVLVKI